MNKDPFFEEGYNDYKEGSDKEDCPYDEGTDGQFGWLRGYRRAQCEEYEKEKSENTNRTSQRDSDESA
jgi:ribosome modulation factor